MKIDRFKVNFTDLARQNRFNVAMFGTGNKVTNLSMKGVHCKVANMPGRGFMTHTPTEFGPRRTVPTATQYDAFDCVFMLDSSMEDRQLLELWQEQIFTSYPEFYMNYFDDYKGMIYLEQLDNLHQVIYRGIMVDAWPMQIGVMNMSQDNKDTIQEVNAQFNYRFWYSEYTNSKPDTFLGGILNKFGKKIGSKITSKLEDMVF